MFTASLNPRSHLPAIYTKHLVRKRLAIATQTVAEARFGALLAGWGQRRMASLERLITSVHAFPPDNETTWEFARLRTACARKGHPLHQKEHIGDIWIAATALRWKIPLVAHDGVFIPCPGLDLRTELDG